MKLKLFLISLSAVFVFMSCENEESNHIGNNKEMRIMYHTHDDENQISTLYTCNTEAGDIKK